jgi:hypothetical protein
LTRLWRACALVAITALVASCGLSGANFNPKPQDLYSIVPSEADVRSLLGDSAWWAGPPSFEVRPLDAETTPAQEKFSVSEDYLRMGTAEELFARYTVYDKTSSASTVMSNYKLAFGNSPSTPKVGDEVLYYPVAGTGGAPYLTRTFVRVGQVVLTLVWARKDNNTQVGMLAKNARAFSAKMRDLNKVHASPVPVDSKLLPPPGRLITFLGGAQLPVEAFVTLTRTPLPDYVLSVLRSSGITTFAYGDYALNNDTHMEVQTGVVRLPSAAAGANYGKLLGPAAEPDTDGIYAAYIPIGGTPAAGVYEYVLAAGQYGLLIICKASIEGEAASKECESPAHATAIAWKLALMGA